MTIPIDAHLYELWANSGENPWDTGELDTFVASVLSYGPRGCGKTYLAEVLSHVSGRTAVELNAIEILKRPHRNLVKQFNKVNQCRGCLLLVEDIDNLVINLRNYPSAHRFLLEQLKQPPSAIVIFATARWPETLRADELDVFHYVLPVFYRDRGGREVIMAACAESILLEPYVDLYEVSKQTEWWSGQELKDLITRSPLDQYGILTRATLLQRVEQIGSNIVAERRRKRTQELLRFTSGHCTSNYIRDDITLRFGPSLELPPEVPAPPKITFLLGDLIMKQEIKQAGVVINPGGQASNVEVRQTYNEAIEGIDLKELALGLQALRLALEKEADSSEKRAAVEVVSAAEVEAKKGNRNRTLDLLAKAGNWSFQTATKIGEHVAAAAIKAAMGLN